MLVVLMSTLLMAAAEPAPSAAPTPEPTNTAAAASHASPKPKTADVTCWEEQPTGSHVTKHICANREQLDKAERDARDATNVRSHPPAGFGH